MKDLVIQPVGDPVVVVVVVMKVDDAVAFYELTTFYSLCPLDYLSRCLQLIF
jgi:hypothetical protein